jgi:hypothetical protein
VRSAMRGSHIPGFFVENDVIKESCFGMHISFPPWRGRAGIAGFNKACIGIYELGVAPDPGVQTLSKRYVYRSFCDI